MRHHYTQPPLKLPNFGRPNPRRIESNEPIRHHRAGIKSLLTDVGDRFLSVVWGNAAPRLLDRQLVDSARQRCRPQPPAVFVTVPGPLPSPGGGIRRAGAPLCRRESRSPSEAPLFERVANGDLMAAKEAAACMGTRRHPRAGADPPPQMSSIAAQ